MTPSPPHPVFPASADADPAATVVHGGAVDAAAERYGIPRDRWLDLSTGINPEPYPVPEIPAVHWHRLPDAGLNERLCGAAARCYGVADPGLVVPAPGSQALIRWLPRLVPATRVAVVVPTYGEHAPSWADAGHGVVAVPDLEDVPATAGVVVVASPNNPDGRTFDRDRLIALGAERLVVVDEAFADLKPETSLAADTGRSGLVVLRSVGKFFGLAGMRLGFALCATDLADALARALGPWAVSGPTAVVGLQALGDADWIARTRRRLFQEARRLDTLLERHGLGPMAGTDLFRLVDHPRAWDVFEHLARLGILVRAFPERPTWLRFGLPGGDEAFGRLDRALQGWGWG